MKRKLILAALLMSMAVTVFADEQIVWEETAVEDAALAETVFENEGSVDEDTVDEDTVDEDSVFEEAAEAGEEITEETAGEEIAFEEIALEENTDETGAETVFEEEVTEELVTEEVSAGDESSAETSGAVAGLVYTGEPQELVTRQEGAWTYSLDGETFSAEVPTAVNAGEYTVYMKEGEEEAVAIVVTIAKADVTFTPPVPNTTEDLVSALR